jgi:hypothetical protein
MKNIKIELDQYLINDEKILWIGYPKSNIQFSIQDLISIPIGIVIIIFLTKDFILGSIDILGILFYVILLYFSFGRFIVNYFTNKSTIYLITNKRVIIFNKSQHKIVRTQNIQDIEHMTKTIRKNGIGTIEFGRIPLSQQQAGNTGLDFLERFKWKDFSAKTMNGKVGPWIPIFYNISDAKYVYELVKGMKESLLKPDQRKHEKYKIFPLKGE